MPNQAHVVPIGCIGNSAGVPQSRLARWVRAGAGYNVVSRALVAQWIEHQLAELGVGGSSPLERAKTGFRLPGFPSRWRARLVVRSISTLGSSKLGEGVLAQSSTYDRITGNRGLASRWVRNP